MVILIITILIIIFANINNLSSISYSNIEPSVFFGIVNFLKGVAVAILFSLIPFWSMKLTGYKNRVSQAAVEIVLFAVVVSVVGYFMFRLNGNGAWMIYSIAVASVMDIGGHIIDQIRENRLNRMAIELESKKAKLDNKKGNSKQNKILYEDITQYANMIDYVSQFDQMFGYERALYAALPIGILEGVCLAIFHQSSVNGYLMYCIQSISFLAAVVLACFIYMSFTKMLIPVYVQKQFLVGEIIFTPKELDKQKDAKEREIGFGKTTTELRELYLFDSVHNILLLSIFVYTFLASINVSFSWELVALIALLLLTLCSQLPFVIGQYLLRQNILECYGGWARGHMETELKKDEFAPLMKKPDILLALFSIGAGGLLFFLAESFIMGLI